MAAGSSPHTRDKWRQITTRSTLIGIIPAYAGQIDKAVQNQIIRRDHPRIRGTNKIVRELSWHEVGSSPHTRDKYAKGGEIAGWRRIIPRIRGTNLNPIHRGMKMPGSSPHTRDKLINRFKLSTRPGIIPAYAGQIFRIPLHERIKWDHPRIRGTNMAKLLKLDNKTGSSPHTRDKLKTLCVFSHPLGIIPAYAGQIWTTSC